MGFIQVKADYHHFEFLKIALSCFLGCLNDYAFVKSIYLWLEHEICQLKYT